MYFKIFYGYNIEKKTTKNDGHRKSCIFIIEEKLTHTHTHVRTHTLINSIQMHFSIFLNDLNMTH